MIDRYILELNKDQHEELLETNDLYKSIWSQIEYLKDYLEPFISFDEIYPKLTNLVNQGIETRNITEKQFFHTVTYTLDIVTTFISEKCRDFHHANLDLSEANSKKVIAKLTAAINKYEAELNDIEGNDNFNGRILPIISSLKDSDPITFQWNLVRLEFATAIALNTRKYFRNLINALESNLNINPKFNEANLLNIVVKSCSRIQGLNKAINKNEKSRTAVLSNFIDNFYIAKDESSWGVSQSSKSLGEPDIRIVNSEKDTISIIEAINLKNIDNTKTLTHINKIYGYDSSGCEFNVFLVFLENENLDEFWSKYVSNLWTLDIKFSIKNFSRITAGFEKFNHIRIGKSEHMKIETDLYHILVKMNE